jgi:hypothetical protein
MKKLCDRCGSADKRQVRAGSATLCPQCNISIQPEIKDLQTAGKPVNILQIARKFFKENHAGGTYMIRDIPATLEQSWKERAIKDGCNQRDVVLAALVEYLK